MPEISLPLFDQPEAVPYGGKTKLRRQASYSGAVHQLRARGEKAGTVLQLVTNGGPITMQDVARISGYGINSVCSLFDSLEKQGLIEEVDHELKEWDNGRLTKRTRWRATR